jgi:hypothetical protein
MSDNSKLKEILTKLKEKGCTWVRVEFSGSGDDGSIQEIEFTPDDPTFRAKELELENELYDYLASNVEIDWVNNEGGGGALEIDMVGDGIKLTLDSYYNETRQVDQKRVKETL